MTHFQTICINGHVDMFEWNDKHTRRRCMGCRVKQYPVPQLVAGEVMKACSINPDYYVTNQGRVFKKQVYYKLLKAVKTRLSAGYPSCSMMINNVGVPVRIHRLVAEAFIEKIPGKNTINHKNGIKTDNRVENLEWCTQKENIDHALATGLRIPKKGEEANQSKLKELEVIEIRKSYKEGVKKAELARRYSVSFSTVSSVISGITWGYLL